MAEYVSAPGAEAAWACPPGPDERPTHAALLRVPENRRRFLPLARPGEPGQKLGGVGPADFWPAGALVCLYVIKAAPSPGAIEVIDV